MTVPVHAFRVSFDEPVSEAEIGASRLAGILHSRPHHHFRVHLANSAAHRRMAHQLVQRMFSWRGYQQSNPVPTIENHRGMLVICVPDTVMGTLSIGADQPGQLLSVEKTFGAEVRALREAGHRLCEFTRLAVEAVAHPKEVLGSLFHGAYRFAERVHGAGTVLVEVNPRHVRFYERLLGFKVLSEVRLNERVQAPAVLLALDLDWGLREMERLGGQPGLAARERSFYPYFLSAAQEAVVLRHGWDAA